MGVGINLKGLNFVSRKIIDFDNKAYAKEKPNGVEIIYNIKGDSAELILINCKTIRDIKRLRNRFHEAIKKQKNILELQTLR